MDKQNLLARLEYIIEDSNSGVLSTVDSEGRPHVRWMTPVLLKDRKGVIFTVTPRDCEKTKQIMHRPDGVWMVQTRDLDQIITARGKINILDNPSIKSEVMESAGDKLTMFWTLNRDISEYVVLETVLEEAEFYQPLKDIRQFVRFGNS
ncbi:MAG TPA: pyridoxamine 5'-phosphate oxidase family protein [Candidatus Atribacteria bacterium]|nr:pyridoxamine 5'-phosphate oxidase family protein [Candidatus Atribacteria bacterium]